jgi:hypothetical protein
MVIIKSDSGEPRQIAIGIELNEKKRCKVCDDATKGENYLLSLGVGSWICSIICCRTGSLSLEVDYSRRAVVCAKGREVVDVVVSGGV